GVFPDNWKTIAALCVQLEGEERQYPAGPDDARELAGRGALIGRVLQRIDAHRRVHRRRREAGLREAPNLEPRDRAQPQGPRPLRRPGGASAKLPTSTTATELSPRDPARSAARATATRERSTPASAARVSRATH